MKILTGNLSSDADRVDFDTANAAKDVSITDPFDPRCARAPDIPITRDSSGPLSPDHDTDQVAAMVAVDVERCNPFVPSDRSADDAILCPNRAVIEKHLYARFNPKF